MFTITDASDSRLLAEATSLSGARMGAMMMHEEGEPLPILIHDAERELERLVEGPHGAMFRGTDLSRKYTS
jgi:hypothetical protein